MIHQEREVSVLLELECVAKYFASPARSGRQQVLDNVSLTVDEGESIAVIGPSGSGKSTLLNIMGALDRPSSGTVRLDGTDLSTLSENELAAVRNRELGFVFQLHHLLPQCTLLENAILPTIPGGRHMQVGEAEGRARRLLERVGLGERIDHRPGQMSGGECQRAAVVRALINRPRVLLADEPTGALDSASADKLAELLIELNQEEKVALVVVTHSHELARRMGKLYQIQGGRLLAADRTSS
jgi:ABC-type lipoprotein export system ATPase subunit